MIKEGIIIKIISNLYTVLFEGETIECRASGKIRNDKIIPVVGDFVVFDYNEKYIKKILDRKNYLHRPPVSNVDVALIITSVKSPNLSLNLLDKQLALVSLNKIEPVICLTKLDLLNEDENRKIDEIRKYYSKIGFKVFDNNQLEEILTYLKGKVVVLTGQTGAGKSSLINKLSPKLNLKTDEISKALGRGKHTTRHTEIFDISGVFFVDTPGFSSLELRTEKDKLKEVYPEFRNANCKYKDCNHDRENDCEVKEKVESGEILKSRYDNYIKFRGEL